MEVKSYLFLAMAICLVSRVNAQFYDSADDIYYYVECDRNGQVIDNGSVYIFNFDGRKACYWKASISTVKRNLQSNPSFYDEKVETTDYELKYKNSNYGTIYETTNKEESHYQGPFDMVTAFTSYSFCFSADRKKMTNTSVQDKFGTFLDLNTGKYLKYRSDKYEEKYKKVDKSFFRVGRSRTPSSTLHE